jgi:hypothetical protein
VAHLSLAVRVGADKPVSTQQIVCTEQTGCSQSGHIVAVGVGDDSTSASSRWTVHEVWRGIDAGDVFYTYADGKVALVHKYRCACGVDSLRSAPDSTTANNLDNLRLCRWKAA